MTVQTHQQLASFIWNICNLLRGPYKRNEYRKVILPLTVLRRFDCILAPTKAKVLREHKSLKGKGENIIRHRLSRVTGVPFYNLSKFTLGMAEKDLLYLVIKKFANVDLSPERVDPMQMGYVFEELIRIGAEQSNEEAGEHFTPREVIKLMVNLLLSPEKDLGKSHVVKTIYDPACGTGGMLSVAEQYIRRLNAEAKPHLFGQDWNDEA